MLGNGKNADGLSEGRASDQIQNIQNTYPWKPKVVAIFVVEQFSTQIISWVLLIVVSKQIRINLSLVPLKDLGPGDQLISLKNARNILKQKGVDPLGKQVRISF